MDQDFYLHKHNNSPGGRFKSFENYAAKLLSKETKWTLFEVRTLPTFLETDFKI